MTDGLQSAEMAAGRGAPRAWRSRPLGALGWTALAVAAFIVAPLVAVVGNVFAPGASTWAHLASTVLPGYVANTALLLMGVAWGVVSIGVLSAWLVTAYRFPGQRVLEWALILPLAMPAYVMAYAYTDWLQFSGPVQSALRAATGWQAREYWFPEIRSLYGAAGLLSFALYPYVYLLARTAFLEQSRSAIEAGRLAGLGAWGTFFRVALPLARPAIAAGTALALMETLADFGVVSYFAVETFTTGSKYVYAGNHLYIHKDATGRWFRYSFAQQSMTGWSTNIYPGGAAILGDTAFDVVEPESGIRFVQMILNTSTAMLRCMVV